MTTRCSRFSLLQTSAVFATAIFTTVIGYAVGSTELSASQTDEHIARTVKTTLDRDDAVVAHLIDVEAKDGVVTLTGSVDNILARRRAAEVTRELAGVVGVINRVSVRPVKIADAELKSRVEAALRAHPATEAKDVTVSVMASVVRLTGQVQSFAERELCWETAASVAGATDVVDATTIEFKLKRPDAEIREDIQARLKDNVWVRAEDIEITVKEGHVTVRGPVGSSEEEFQVRLSVLVNGVTELDSKGLRIDPRKTSSSQKQSSIRNRNEIRAALTRTLNQDPRVGSTAVIIDASNGAVTLNGVVGSLAAKIAAGRDAENTPGVWSVNNELRVRPAELRSSEEIAQDVRAALKRDAYLHGVADDIRVFVLNNQVFLRGDVNKRYERLRAADVVAQVKGVVTITNGLQAPLPEDAPDDEEIRQAILEQLQRNPLVESKKLTVQVLRGDAILTGVVFDWREHRAARQCAFQGGARRVFSNVKPLHGPDVMRY